MLCELLGNFAWDVLCTSANPLKEQVLRPESVMGSNFRCIPPITHTSVVKHRVILLRFSSLSVFLQNDHKTRPPVENAARLGDDLGSVFLQNKKTNNKTKTKQDKTTC